VYPFAQACEGRVREARVAWSKSQNGRFAALRRAEGLGRDVMDACDESLPVAPPLLALLLALALPPPHLAPHLQLVQVLLYLVFPRQLVRQLAAPQEAQERLPTWPVISSSAQAQIRRVFRTGKSIHGTMSRIMINSTYAPRVQSQWLHKSATKTQQVIVMYAHCYCTH